MRVLYDYAAFTMQPRGGVSRVMHELVRYGMQRSDVECSVWGGIHQNYALESLSRQHPGKVQGIRIPQKWAKLRVLMPLNGAFFPLYSYRFNPDICHYTFFMTPAVPKGTKTVITVHDLINELFPQHYNPEDRQADLRSKALRKADGVICVSEHTRNDLLRLYDLDPKKVIVAYNGNSMVNVQPINAELTDPFFLFVGDRRGWRKNFDVVLGCLAGSQELEKYMLVCFGDQEFSAQETTRFAELGLAGRILHRSGSDEVLAGYYKSAAALIYPSRYEGFGLPPVEAMTFGCPVVSSNAPPMSEIIGDAGLFFDPESAGDLHARLRSVIHDEKQVRELMERGYQRVGLFSWEKSCRKIFDFYDQLLNP